MVIWECEEGGYCGREYEVWIRKSEGIGMSDIFGKRYTDYYHFGEK